MNSHQVASRTNRRVPAYSVVIGLILFATCHSCASETRSPRSAAETAEPVVDRQEAPAEPADSEEPGIVEAGSPPQQIEPSVPPPANDEDPLITRGRALFAKHCTICHGDRGDGQGKFAYLMNPRPRNFEQEPFKLATTVNRIPTDADLLRTISRGMPGSAMPPWRHLPKSDLEALVGFVRLIGVEATEAELRQRVAEGELAEADIPEEIADRRQPGPPLTVPAEPPFDDLRWFRGRQVYLEACASCHGLDGHPVPEAIKYDEQGYPVPPRSFVNGIFKGGSEGHQMYARIIKGMPGTPMPESEGAYPDDEVWDLIHYVQTLARQGAQERAQLQMSTFVAPNVNGVLPEGPLDSAWDQARPAYVGLTPLWWTEDRIEGLVVQALHNGEELAIRLSWIDPTQDTRAVGQHEFRDGVAIQFSLSADPPFYMGSAGEHGGVNIWYWKADRQRDLALDYQGINEAYPDNAVDEYPPDPAVYQNAEQMMKAKTEGTPRDYFTYLTAWAADNLVAARQVQTPVECLVARGPGTLSGKPANVQLVQGKAVYERGVWTVQMQRPMQLTDEHGHDESDERTFTAGDYLPVSFAIWDGSAGDRDGKKSISIWQKLVIE